MRTEAVDDVYVHYITQLSSPEWSASNLVNIHPKQGVLLHYKVRVSLFYCAVEFEPFILYYQQNQSCYPSRKEESLAAFTTLMIKGLKLMYAYY